MDPGSIPGGSMKPYYEDGLVRLYHGDAREIVPTLEWDALVTDPPFGIAYHSGHEGDLARSVVGDDTTELRNWALGLLVDDSPAAVFATCRCVPPRPPRGQLIWWKNVGGMGDLSFPWSPDYEVVWIYGSGWHGHRGSSVLRGRTIPTWNSGPARRRHPTEKPEDVLGQIIKKLPAGSRVLDPFAGSGSTLVAARDLGYPAIGVEIEERYCETAARRLSQCVLDFGGAA